MASLEGVRDLEAARVTWWFFVSHYSLGTACLAAAAGTIVGASSRLKRIRSHRKHLFRGAATAFLTGTFDFFLTAADPATGYPADGYRLVQRWCWYSLDAPDDYYPTGRLFNPNTGGMTAVGEGWSGYVEGKLSP